MSDRYQRLTALGIGPEDALTLASDEGLLAFFDGAADEGRDPNDIANWVINELPRVTRDRELLELPFDGAALGRLVGLVSDGALTGAAAKEVLEILAKEGGDPAEIVAERGLERVADPEALVPLVDRIVSENPEKAAAFRNGKTGLIGFFMGQMMRETGGSADPELARKLLEERLRSEGV